MSALTAVVSILRSDLAAAVARQDSMSADGDPKSTPTEQLPWIPAVQISVRRTTESGPDSQVDRRRA